MKNIQKVINQLEKFNTYIKELKEVSIDVLIEPVKIGKWSAIEIISHIQFWDRYLIETTIPMLRQGDEIQFPNHDNYNENAVLYVNNGKTTAEVINETINWRKKLLRVLSEVQDEIVNKPIVINGNYYCPNTGERYTLLYLCQEFADHDLHHIHQINEKLNSIR
ncbi:DinB family protein [Bacillus wiedmannii]|uniref:DinB family protein n=1 Tax=Bacillus wiedmannii TaxID=1890302 RepID=UPI000BF1C1AE|nr:DinB family protein [Bacillus wiedmannii]PEL51880.1 hypothetical protein CN622_30100 [Bacillus wiedmannii]PEO05021.1 hypothetical protein CN562_29780 [Bacillus wiedmannii]PEP98153.1 hypothetical protein CN587_30325 [Bacillus wiedmannii]